MVEYKATKFSIDEYMLTAKVDWYSYSSKARKEATLTIQHFVTKWISGDTATGKTMTRRKQQILPKCEKLEEHLLHILTCLSEDSIEFCTALILDLEIWLETRERIHRARLTLIFLIKGPSSWFKDPFAAEPEYNITYQVYFRAVYTVRGRMICASRRIHSKSPSDSIATALHQH